MNKTFYSNAVQYKGQILLQGYDNGKRVKERIPYQPYLFVDTKDESEYRTIFGNPVERINFRSIGAARDYMQRYKDVSNYNIYGMTQWVYPFLFDRYAKEKGVEYDRDVIKILWFDIETETGRYDDDLEVKVRKTERHEEIYTTVEQLYKWIDYEVFDIKYDRWSTIKSSCYLTDTEFPNPAIADKEINSVTFRINGKNIVLGFYDYTPEDKDTTFIKCENEIALLYKMIDIIVGVDPDIITAWNSSYDINYTTNRIAKILGEDEAKKLSPWGIIEKKMIHDKFGNDSEQITWVGLSAIDYIETYKKFQSATQENYKLDYIAELELGVGKIDYSEYGSLRALYILNRSLYYKYNIIDVERLTQIEEKLKLFDVQLSLAYYMNVNYIDVFGTVKPWDAFIHNYLMRQGIVVPQSDITEQADKLRGAFVKEPIPGMYKWVTSFDVKSLYPSLARQCNISPETLIATLPNVSPENILNRTVNPEIIKTIKEQNVSLCGTGCIFDNSFEGFIAACMRLTYEERVAYQKEHKKYKLQLSDIEKEMKKRGLKIN